ncbi:MAG: hypothetical protein WCG27_05830 [Pseudomonadota bacterium]
MKYRPKFILALTFLIFLLNAFADDSCPLPCIGEVANVVAGTVQRINKQRSLNNMLSPEAKIYQGDILISERKGFVKIVMKDNVIVFLGDESKMSFDNSFLPGDTAAPNYFWFDSGKVKILTNSKSKSTVVLKVLDLDLEIKGKGVVANLVKDTNQNQLHFLGIDGDLLVSEQHSSKQSYHRWVIPFGTLVMTEATINPKDRKLDGRIIPSVLVQLLNKKSDSEKDFLKEKIKALEPASFDGSAISVETVNLAVPTPAPTLKITPKALSQEVTEKSKIVGLGDDSSMIKIPAPVTPASTPLPANKEERIFMMLNRVYEKLGSEDKLEFISKLRDISQEKDVLEIIKKTRDKKSEDVGLEENTILKFKVWSGSESEFFKIVDKAPGGVNKKSIQRMITEFKNFSQEEKAIIVGKFPIPSQSKSIEKNDDSAKERKK